MERNINAHVICFTEGPYKSTHHRFMAFGGINPDGSGYFGDKNLKWAVEIDLVKFFRALGSKLGPGKKLKGLPVEYGERRRSIGPNETSFIDSSSLSWDEILSAVFTKKTVFGGEREYRIMLYNDDGSLLHGGDPFIKITSAALRNSLLGFHKLSGTPEAMDP